MPFGHTGTDDIGVPMVRQRGEDARARYLPWRSHQADHAIFATDLAHDSVSLTVRIAAEAGLKGYSGLSQSCTAS